MLPLQYPKKEFLHSAVNCLLPYCYNIPVEVLQGRCPQDLQKNKTHNKPTLLNYITTLMSLYTLRVLRPLKSLIPS